MTLCEGMFCNIKNLVSLIWYNLILMFFFHLLKWRAVWPQCEHSFYRHHLKVLDSLDEHHYKQVDESVVLVYCQIECSRIFKNILSILLQFLPQILLKTKLESNKSQPKRQTDNNWCNNNWRMSQMMFTVANFNKK